MAIVGREEHGEACARAIADSGDCMISAGTLAEAFIVSEGRDVGDVMAKLVDQTGLQTIPVTEATARHIRAAYRLWGKGFHPASLNYGDCFAYALAKESGRALLFLGSDFSRTDVRSVL